MTRALFKKQMLEVFAWVYKDRKSGKRRNTAGIVRYALLYLVIFGFLGVVFYMAANLLCGALVTAGVGWLYWCLMGLIALFLGVFGSVFNTYSSLYQAKDNDLLLAMPIPASRILLVRLSGVYAMGLMYELIVMIPTLIVWFMTAPFSAVGAVCALLIPWVLSVLILVLSAVLGWVVALVAGRLKRKNILVVLVSLVFMVAYYYCYSRAYAILQSILLNAAAVGAKMKAIVYPLYQMGRAAEGNALSMLIFTAIIGALFAVVYAVLSRSFLRLATASSGTAKVAYHERRAAVRPVHRALLYKELRRFLGSANYMLNCGLGILLMPIAAAVLVWKAETVRTFAAEFLPAGLLPLLVTAAVCLLAAMNDITAPSVSLEGKNLWLSQSLPVSARQVLAAKLRLHLWLTLVPAVPLLAAAEWVAQPSPTAAILMPVTVGLFVLLSATAGLMLNLKMPNLNWTSEIVPIKQSMSVMLALFGGWGIVLALGGLYALLSSQLTPVVYTALVCGVLALADGLLLRRLMTTGARLYASL